MYVNLYLIFPNNLENRYGVPFTINSLLSDITKIILKYHKIKHDIFTSQNVKSFLISQNIYVHGCNKFDFVISQNQICHITY